MDTQDTTLQVILNQLYLLQRAMDQNESQGTVSEVSFRRVRQSLAIWTELFGSDDFALARDAGVALFASPEAGNDFVDSATALIQDLPRLTRKHVTEYCQRLDASLLSYAQRLEKRLSGMRSEPRDTATQTIQISNVLYGVRRLIAEAQQLEAVDRITLAASLAEKSAREASNAKDNAIAASGTAGELGLAKDFVTYGDAEAATAEKYRVATIALIALGVVASFILHANGLSSVPEAIYKLAALGAVFALSGYLARQAGHHRHLAVWAKTIAVQLRTFEAFLDPVTEPSIKNQARLAFASRVFGALPDGKDATAAPSSEVLEQMMSLVTKASAAK